MATVKKVSKVKNLSAGPSKKTPIAPKVDPQGQYTKVQERTLGNMKKGGKVKKAQGGDSLTMKRAEVYKANKPVLDSAQKENTKKVLEQIGQKQLKSKPTMRSLKKGGKVKNWIQKAVKTMRTDKPCTGPKFGSKTCPPGSKRYNLAKTFKKMSKKK